MLDGFTLAVEIAAVYLHDQNGYISCADYLNMLQRDGLVASVEYAGDKSKTAINHTKLITATLKPTLELLSNEEKLILNYASLLPPESIPVVWLKALVTAQYPELGEDVLPGIIDPWLIKINHLFSLRLLQIVDLGTDGLTPQIVRIHRLVQEVILVDLEGKDTFTANLFEHCLSRSAYLETNWYNKSDQWEINPLVNFTELLLDKSNVDAPQLVIYLGQCLHGLHFNNRHKKILLHAVKLLQNKDNYKQTDLAVLYSNLAAVEKALGNFKNAKDYLLKAVNIDELNFAPDHPALATLYSNLAMIEKDLGNLKDAKDYLLKAINIAELNFAPNHPTLATLYSNLALVERPLGNLKDAKDYLLKAIKIGDVSYEPNHPTLSTYYSNLAMVERMIWGI